MDKKKITLVPNELPQFDGTWTVGEVLSMAQALAGWVESLQVNQPKPEIQPEEKGL